jgi:hypothetical protein
MTVLALMAPVFQQSDGGGSAAAALPGLIIGIFAIVCLWRVFGKAGEPGWYAIIPIWNAIVMLKIAGKPWWWIFLFFIPILNIVLFVMAMLGFGRAFGKGGAFSFFLLFCFQIIGIAIIAFDSSRYVGPGGETAYR